MLGLGLISKRQNVTAHRISQIGIPEKPEE
jgi:hypothetical protein